MKVKDGDDMNNSQDLISVIIPVYNTGKYLNKCFDSVINQTYKNIEIILINDGSTDNSDSICLEYKNKDSRIVYIKKENEGVSKARNTALDIVKGKYIAFVDSDDFIEEDYIEKMINAIRKNDADLCECNMNKLNVDNEIIGSTNLYNAIIEGKEKVKWDFANYNNAMDYVANKLIKRDTIGEERFSDLIVSEDYEFFTRVYENINKKVTISDKLYNYILYPKKETTEKFIRNGLETIRAREKVFKQYMEKNEIELAHITAVQLLFRIMTIYKKVDHKTKIILKEKYREYYPYALKTKATFLKKISRYIRFYKFKLYLWFNK